MQEVIVVLVCIIYASLGYPNGPPSSACADATPQHGDFTPEVKESCPYLVVAERFVPGEKIILNITSWSGVETFRGFQLTVFEPETYRAMGIFGKKERTICDGAAATHSEGEKKLFYELEWTPPKDSSGQIYIIWLTIVQSFSKFWTDCDQVQLAATDANVKFTTPAWFGEAMSEETTVSRIFDTNTANEVAPKITPSRISGNIEKDTTSSKTPSQKTTTIPQNSTPKHEKTIPFYQNTKLSNDEYSKTKVDKTIRGRHLNSATKHTATISQTMCILFIALLFY